MSKRFFPQQLGDRKRAKLDVSISDHNFPLSQNNEPEKSDTWGDDNDDEILLLASQACEEVFSNNVSLLPNYSMFIQPASSSTQLSPSPGPSTSKTEFTFKQPSANPTCLISTNLKEKCNRISSPLPGITAKVLPKANEPVNLSDDIIFNDKIYKGQDSDYVYKQLLQLQEENVKLKCENGKLLEKCVTKEGEASILRTQLKTCQVAVDNARLDKIKAQERVQMEWTDKLAAANGQMQDLRTQLDFKNLEIISVKEKCKRMESNKVKSTQVTIANNDISSSHRNSNSFSQTGRMTQSRVKTTSNAVQTEDKAHFLPLNTIIKPATSPLLTLLPLILEPTPPPRSLLDHCEQLSRSGGHKYRVFSTYHRMPSGGESKQTRETFRLDSIYEDVVKIAGGCGEKEVYFNIFRAAVTVLSEAAARLETISRRSSSPFLKEMDEKYMETAHSSLTVRREDLLSGRALFKDEQEILARRMSAILSYVLDIPGSAHMLTHFQKYTHHHLGELLTNICTLLDTTSTACLHGGLVLSLLHLPASTVPPGGVRGLVRARAPPAAGALLARAGAHLALCSGTGGNLKTDYDQGVLLFKKDSCHLQILIKQVEAYLKCIERAEAAHSAAVTTRDLLRLYCHVYGDGTSTGPPAARCDCQIVLIQVIVYALKICAAMLANTRTEDNGCPELVSVCRAGLGTLYRCTQRELCSRLGLYEGHLTQYCHVMRHHLHSDIYVNMLSEVCVSLHSSPEEMPPSFHRQPWLRSFDTLHLED